MSVPNFIHEEYVKRNGEPVLSARPVDEEPVRPLARRDRPAGLEELVGAQTLWEKTKEFVLHQPTWKHRWAQVYGALLVAGVKSPWYEPHKDSIPAERFIGKVSDGLDLARIPVEAPLYIADALMWAPVAAYYGMKTYVDSIYQLGKGLFQYGKYGAPGWHEAMDTLVYEKLAYNSSEITNFHQFPWHHGGPEQFFGLAEWADKAQFYPLTALMGVAALYGVAKWKRHTLKGKTEPVKEDDE